MNIIYLISPIILSINQSIIKVRTFDVLWYMKRTVSEYCISQPFIYLVHQHRPLPRSAGTNFLQRSSRPYFTFILVRKWTQVKRKKNRYTLLSKCTDMDWKIISHLRFLRLKMYEKISQKLVVSFKRWILTPEVALKRNQTSATSPPGKEAKQ